MLAVGAWRELVDLKDAVTESGAGFDVVRAWFAAHLVPMFTRTNARGRG